MRSRCSIVAAPGPTISTRSAALLTVGSLFGAALTGAGARVSIRTVAEAARAFMAGIRQALDA